MKTRLPDIFFSSDSKSAPLYIEYIADFSDNDYQQKRSDLFGKHVVHRIRNMDLSGDHTIKDIGQAKKSIGGHIFELLVAEILVMHKIAPIYTQVEMWKVPSSKFDFLLFHEVTPVLISCKLSFAERWRQASVEGIMLKNIYRQGKCFLLCADLESKVKKRNNEISNSQIDGIDQFYIVGSEELVDLLNDLSEHPFSTPKKIEPIVSFSKLIPK